MRAIHTHTSLQDAEVKLLEASVAVRVLESEVFSSDEVSRGVADPSRRSSAGEVDEIGAPAEVSEIEEIENAVVTRSVARAKARAAERENLFADEADLDAERLAELLSMQAALADLEAELAAASKMARTERRIRRVEEERSKALGIELARVKGSCSEHIARCANILQQVNFYFSPTNLQTDTYLNRHMDPNTGYVPLAVLVTFPRMMMLGASVRELVALLQDSAVLDVDALTCSVRRKPFV